MVGTDRPRPQPVCGTELRTALNRAEMVPPTWREEAGAGWGRFLAKAPREALVTGAGGRAQGWWTQRMPALCGLCGQGREGTTCGAGQGHGQPGTRAAPAGSRPRAPPGRETTPGASATRLWHERALGGAEGTRPPGAREPGSETAVGSEHVERRTARRLEAAASCCLKSPRNTLPLPSNTSRPGREPEVVEPCFRRHCACAAAAPPLSRNC